jgi:DnaA family protein
MAAHVHPQLPLGVRLREVATFANYFPGRNGEPVRLLQDGAVTERERFVYLWGPRGTGKTHLLQALCHRTAGRGEPTAYLPLREAVVTPEAVEGLEQLPLVVIDDVDAAAGQAVWETALFHLHNRIRERGGRLVMAGLRGPAALGVALADLRSRLAGGLVLQLHALDDGDKAEALRLQARQRGLVMPQEVAGYLLRRCPRDMGALFALLDTLDQASLAAQRKLTVPFVKEILGLKA